jgi:hypothetical protein
MPSRGRGNDAGAVARAVSRHGSALFDAAASAAQASLNFSSPSFSIELTISSPDFSQTCFSFG